MNTTDRAGGAEHSARTILDGFEHLGTDVSLAVGIKLTDDPRVVTFESNTKVDRRRGTGARRRALSEAQRRYERRLGMEVFAHPHSHHILDLVRDRVDLVLLMNLHGGYFDLRILPRLSRQVPVVARLCDSWMFTGHCACPPYCGRWETGCGSCPDLAIPPAVEHDLTHLNWRRKRHVLRECELAVTTPSHWLMERAQRSILAPAIREAKVVSNGLDLEVFAPGPREHARASIGLNAEAKILLFVAHEGRANPFKDFPTLRSAMKLLRDPVRDDKRLVELLVVGREGPLEVLGADVRIRHLAGCDHRKLAELYRAADIYVHSAPEETFCNSAAEALACGIPVVAACAGGIREVVEHQLTGIHVAPGDPRSLAAALDALLDADDRRRQMGQEAARRACTRFDRSRTTAELHSWCEQVASKWRSSPACRRG